MGIKKIKKRIKNSVYIKSFKSIKWNIIIIALYTLFFVVFLMLISNFFTFLITKLGIEKFMTQSAMLGAQNMEAITKQVLSKIFFVLIYVILYFILLVLSWSFFENLVYNKIYKNKFKLNVFLKFSVINALFMIVWFFIIFLAGSFLKENVIPYVITLFIIPLTIIFVWTYYILFFKEEKIFKTLKETVSLICKRFLKIILVFILAFITGFIIITPFLFLGNLFQNNTIDTIITAVPLLLILAWQRIYLTNAVNDIN